LSSHFNDGFKLYDYQLGTLVIPTTTTTNQPPPPNSLHHPNCPKNPMNSTQVWMLKLDTRVRSRLCFSIDSNLDMQWHQGLNDASDRRNASWDGLWQQNAKYFENQKVASKTETPVFRVRAPVLLDYVNAKMLVPGGETPVHDWVPERYLEVKGGVVGDEMGLGKTLTVLALVLAAPHPLMLLKKDGAAEEVEEPPTKKQKGAKGKSKAKGKAKAKASTVVPHIELIPPLPCPRDGLKPQAKPAKRKPAKKAKTSIKKPPAKKAKTTKKGGKQVRRRKWRGWRWWW